MTAQSDDSAATNLRFKRRKTTHTKRARTDYDGLPTIDNEDHDAASAPNALEEETAPNLKEIMRNRKRPRDRFKDTAHRSETSHLGPALVDVPKQDRYTSRFVAQTGQVVDSSDAQM